MNEGKDLTFSANSCSTISAIFAVGWFPTLSIVLRGKWGLQFTMKKFKMQNAKTKI
jgi:hypothetical protein